MMRALLWVGGLTLSALAARPGLAQPQEAQPQETQPQETLRVAVLRGTSGEAEPLAQAVDGALLRDLSAIAGIDSPTVSPIDYAEIQLAVGCTDEAQACLSSIAQTIEVDAIVVRKLRLDDESASLGLLYFDASASDAPSSARQKLPTSQAEQLVEHVPALVRELFGIPEPVAPAEPEAQPATQDSVLPASAPAAFQQPEPTPAPASTLAKVSLLSWAALGTGAALFGAGLVVGLDAQGDFDDWKGRAVESRDDAAGAQSDFASIEQRGTVSSVLMVAGGAVLALGGTLLALDLVEEGSPPLSVASFHDGFAVQLQGALGGP